MKEFAKSFYLSDAWRNCREGYYKSVGGLCELCLKEGKYTAGEIVHHKKHITPATINDPDVTLSWDNLLLVCREHHAQLHGAKQRRFMIGKNGNVIPYTDQ